MSRVPLSEATDGLGVEVGLTDESGFIQAKALGGFLRIRSPSCAACVSGYGGGRVRVHIRDYVTTKRVSGESRYLTAEQDTTALLK